MVFTSSEFILFLAAVFVLYYAIPPKRQKALQWKILLAASGFFYYMTGVSNLIYIGVTIVTTYSASLVIGKLLDAQEQFVTKCKNTPDIPKTETKAKIKAYKNQNNKKRLFLLTVCLLINFGLLGIIKVNWLAILGASFYIFRSMSYIIDVHRAKFKPLGNDCIIGGLPKFALFVSFFPLIMQGPITRYNETAPALFGGNRFDFQKVSFGVQRMLWGFFKKLVIADRLNVAVITLCNDPEQYGGIYALLAMLFYAITLYADFTGGIDITIGIGEALGIPIAENFNRPFLSRNIFEYWRRWHITMGTWFKDYLFYPLSVCKPMLKFSGFTRRYFGEVGKRIPVHIVTLVTWFATGIWHGFSWNFIVWGLLNGVVIIISTESEPLYRRFNNRFAFTKTAGYACFEVFRTFWLMCFIRSFDCYIGVRTTLSVHLSIITNFGWKKFTTEGLAGLGLTNADYAIVAAGVVALIAVSCIKTKLNKLKDTTDEVIGVRQWLSGKPLPFRFAVYGTLLFGIIIFGVYGFGYNAQQFIYTRF
ncbi:MAG: MBOAT family protein [Oscillospiraceae bacterium]|nr:MBOAT family protein [Oscillospiraceae bacterium]